MPTHLVTSSVACGNDAEFRALVSEFITALTTCGLVQTADTGQINPATVNRPATTNTNAGYAIFRFADTLQATAPIFLRFDFGLAGALNVFRVFVQVGTGTNGAGTLTGITSVSMQVTNSNAPNQVSPFPSYFCHNTALGYFGFGYKLGATGTGYGLFIMQRSVDQSTGLANGTGALILYTATTSNSRNIQNLRFAATAQAFTADTNGRCTVVPEDMSASLLPGTTDIQAFLHFGRHPQVWCASGICTVIVTEVALGTTFTTTLVGSTPRTFIGQGSPGISGVTGGNSTATHTVALLWE